MNRIVDLYPQQFKEKSNIEKITSAFQAQIDELLDVFSSLKTGRNLTNAVGKQLDYIGESLGLSRIGASEMLNMDIDSLDDETYRLLLRFTILKNTSSATYYDVIKAIQITTGVEEIHYREDYTHPARIYLSSDDSVPIEMANAIFRSPKIKPAGVALEFGYATEDDLGKNEFYVGGTFVWADILNKLPILV